VAPSKQKKGKKKEEVVGTPMTNSNAKKIWRSVDIYGWFLKSIIWCPMLRKFERIVDIYGWFKKSITWSPMLRKFEELLIYMGDLKNL
jgi:hypothetical protein